MGTIKDKNRKISRSINSTYVNVIKPENIPDEHWEMWLKFNAGLTTTEIAMTFHTKVHTVTSIISKIVELLKNKPKIINDWSYDFKDERAAMDFRERIRNNIAMAVKSKLPIVTIMSEL